MASRKDWRNELHQVAEFLRDPFKMRMAVAGFTLAIMCFVINDPLQGKMQVGNRKLTELRSTVRTAEQVMLLRDQMSQVEDRIFQGKGNDAVLSHLIELIRGESVDLMRIDAGASEKLGPLKSVRVTLDLLGPYENLMRLLNRFDSDQFLIRVENIAIAPPNKDRSTSSLNMTLRIMKETS